MEGVRSWQSLRARERPLALLLLALITASCAYHSRASQATPPSRAQLNELWDHSAAIERRDLFNGTGGRALAPSSGQPFTFVETDWTGSSPGYKVKDRTGREWDVKLGPEGPVEVVVSRLVWAIGFHQPPTYYVADWTLNGGPKPGRQPGGRFRPKLPSLHRGDTWSWHENPFVGTRELRGLFVLMVILNNWDLKTTQNRVYDVRTAGHAHREYVVQDLGASLGRTRWFFPGSKGEVTDYEREPLIDEVRNGVVRFHYRGAWREPSLDDQVTPADVVWICSLLNRLSDRQLADAFRAGGYDTATTLRFTRHLRDRVQEGLRLRTTTRAAGE